MDSLPDRPQPSRPVGEIVHAWLVWFGLGRLIVTALAIVGVGAGGYWLLRAPAPAIENSLPYAQPLLTSTSVAVGNGQSSTTQPAGSEPTSLVHRAFKCLTVPQMSEIHQEPSQVSLRPKLARPRSMRRHHHILQLQ